MGQKRKIERLQQIILEQQNRIESLENKLKYVETLENKVKSLEARLAKYENAHTPPSLTEKKRPPSDGSGKPGQKEGHPGITRPQPEPTEHIESKLDACPHCHSSLGEPTRTERRIIEEIPEPQPVRVIEYISNHYWCEECNTEIIASNPDMPTEGRFGKNVITMTVLGEFEDRLPIRKIRNMLERQYGLIISPGSLYDFTQRACESMQREYATILQRIRDSPWVHIDETGVHVNCNKYWIWIFVTRTDSFIIIRKSRGLKVLVEVLSRKYNGTIICDGWKAYPNFTDRIQRCWSHLLRETRFVAEDHDEAILLDRGLRRLFHRVTGRIDEDPPPEERNRIWREARATMKWYLKRYYENPIVLKLVAKIMNGFDHWFTFIRTPGIEPTNNRAERALRESVVQRKIFGTLRNTKGTHIREVIMSVLATWKLQGKNLYRTLRMSL
jgi:transposase